MEAGENSTLRLRGEVDERVATDQQIEPRDRRVLGEVVPPEDDRPPECGAKDKSLPLAIEKPILEVRVERPQDRFFDRQGERFVFRAALRRRSESTRLNSSPSQISY